MSNSQTERETMTGMTRQQWEQEFISLVCCASDCNYATAYEIMEHWAAHADDWKTTFPYEAAGEALSWWFDVD